MRVVWKPAFFVVLVFAAAACSVGGGGSSGGVPVTGGGSKSAAKKTKLAVTVHIPAARASTAARHVFAGKRAPKFISSAAEGLAILLEDSSTTQNIVAETNADIFDTTNNTTPNTSSCVDDTGDSGRTCTITVTATAGTYYFVADTYTSIPTVGSDNTIGFFGSTTPLDSGNAGNQTLAVGTLITIPITLGGAVASVNVTLPPSTNAYAAQTIPVGVVAEDAAGEIIISSDPYSTPISVSVANALTGPSLPTLTLNGTTSGTGVTSTQSSDTVVLNYPVDAAADAGNVVTVSASTTATTQAATAPISPLYLTEPQAAAGTMYTVAASPTIAFTSAATASFDIVEGASGTPAFTVALDQNANAGCANDFTLGAVSGSGSTQTFTLASNGTDTPSGGCQYDVSDGYTTVALIASTANGNGSGTVTTTVPGNTLYLTAFQAQNATAINAAANPPNARPNPGPSGPPLGPAAVLLSRLSDAKLNTIQDTTDIVEPLGIAHDAAGDVFVADGYYDKVFEYGTGSIVAYPGAANATPSKVLGGFTTPDGLAVDQHNGNVYVTDFSASIVSVFTAGSTTPTYTLNVGADPAGIALDSAGNMYVAYPGAAAVLEYAAPTASGSITAIAQIGSGANYVAPTAVTIGPSGQIYILDTNAGGNGNTALLTFMPGVSTPVTTALGNAAVTAVGLNASGATYVTGLANGVLDYTVNGNTISIGGPTFAGTTFVPFATL